MLKLSKFGLNLHPEKTRLINFAAPVKYTGKQTDKPGTFNFLGFTFYWDKSRKGKWTVVRKTAKDRLRRSLSNINQWCRQNWHQCLAVQAQTLNVKLRSNYQYFGVTGNSHCLRLFRYHVLHLWKNWLSKRTNQHLSWNKFNENIYPTFYVLQIKIYHSVYAANP